ncbi:MAG: sulfonate ABC transporter substrate-binding protein [Chroococcidiopsidaceae cyanobacterium CP_BM_RX_35]|nr:sulfonate ABC transporter substrate-binding protein [Chroococcidiopsidaceae cyanobacterium CP_BM_RX_35]
MLRRLFDTWKLLFTLSLCLSLLFAACSPDPNGSQTRTTNNSVSDKVSTIRIGYQKFTEVDILRRRGTLEKKLKPLGVAVEWSLFQSGPREMEALSAGAIDLAGGVGDTPPIFAQAAGTELVYIAAKPAEPRTYGILVRQSSPIQTLVDLKGKRVALAKGSSANYLIVKALKSVHLQYSDIQPVYLSPAEASSAFTQKQIDAWVIWDPNFTVAQQRNKARILTTGEGLTEHRGFFLATRSFAEGQPDLIKDVFNELSQSEDWAKSHPQELAEQYAPQLGLDVVTVEKLARRRSYGMQPINDSVISTQQSIADTFFQLKLIPKQIAASQVVWKAK